MIESFGATVELSKGTGGVFEEVVDGKLRFSKKALERLPTDGELNALLTA